MRKERGSLARIRRLNSGRQECRALAWYRLVAHTHNAQLQHKYPAMLVYPAWHNPSPTPSYLTEPAAFCLFIHPTSYAANSKMFSITRSFVALVLICSTLNILVHAVVGLSHPQQPLPHPPVPNSLVSITGGVGPIGGTVEPLVKLPGSIRKRAPATVIAGGVGTLGLSTEPLIKLPGTIRKRAPATVIAGGVGTLGLSTEPLIKLPGTIRKRASGTEPFIVNWDPKHTGDKGKRASATEPIHNLPISKDSKKGKRAAATEPIEREHRPMTQSTSCQSIISEANELLFEGMSTLPQDMTTTTATAHAMARTLFSCIELLLVPIANPSLMPSEIESEP
ncbi:hypothetical protein H4Q26_009324 [Puccinia striiformis f. sp. tritici PST-130]|nr:hypothetical protein H4Q26_009324 [Puccinia striiformis f. sp. tritici PST-130]